MQKNGKNAMENEFGKILKTLIIKKEIRMSDLAKATGLPQANIHRLIYGKTKKAKPNTLKRIADYFNISVGQLIGEEPIKWALSKNKFTVFKNIIEVPVYKWEKQNNVWEQEILASGELRTSTTDKKISETSFAFELKDSSMEPVFYKGAVIIVDPTVQPKTESYVVVKLKDLETVVFRRLLIDIDVKHLIPLNSNFESRVLKKEDRIEGVVVRANLDFEF